MSSVSRKTIYDAWKVWHTSISDGFATQATEINTYAVASNWEAALNTAAAALNSLRSYLVLQDAMLYQLLFLEDFDLLNEWLIQCNNPVNEVMKDYGS